jgi:hypothetical protein
MPASRFSTFFEAEPLIASFYSNQNFQTLSATVQRRVSSKLLLIFEIIFIISDPQT